MIIFIAFYFYFLIQVMMATKGNDPVFTIDNFKDKIGGVPLMVEKKTKNVKKKITDESVVVIEKVKDITEKAGKTIKEGKNYVVDKCKNLKTKINDVQLKSKKNISIKNSEANQNSLTELVEMNKQLVELTKKLIDKYEENSKLINELSRNLVSTKEKTKERKTKK